MVKLDRSFCWGLLVLGLLISLNGQAQNGSIQGTIVKENDTTENLGFVNVILKNPGDTAHLTGTTTNKDGTFQFNGLDYGSYNVGISYVGYQKRMIENVQISNNAPNKDLGLINIRPSAKQMDAIEVESERNFMTQSPEGLTINPSKDITQTGGSAIDILQNTPTVNVTFDGGIKMRGTEAGATQVLINGRQSALSNNVDQIPASAIERIEVIHNPGAKYRAEGKGGVINIVLKKQTEEGTNGQVQLSAGSRNRYNTSLQLNHGTESLNYFLNFNRRYDVDIEDARSRRDALNVTPNKSYIEEGNEREFATNNTVRGGAEFYWNYFNKLGVDVLFENENEDNEATMNNRVLEGETLIQNRDINTTTSEKGYSIEPTLYYKRDFVEDKRELNLSAKYSYDHQDEEQYTEKRSFLDPGAQQFQIFENNQLTTENRTLSIIRGDYTDPVFNNGLIEAGIRTQYREIDSDYDYEEFNERSSEWENLQTISNKFLYQEQVHAGYFQYSHELNNWTLMGGIRVERTNVTIDPENESKREKAYLDFFPSSRIQYKFNQKHSINLSYSKKIDRPSAWRLNPYPDLTDSSSIFIGNPNVDPEYIHSFEFTHSKRWEGVAVNSALFYRDRKGIVDYLTQINSQGTPIIRPQNLAKGTTYGLEVTTTLRPADWWRLNVNGSVYNSRIEGTITDFQGSEEQGSTISNEDVTYNGKFNTTIQLPLNLRYQLTGNFQGPEVEALEKEKANYYFNMGLQKPLFDGNGSIGLNVQDFFDTRQMEEIGGTENFNEQRINERQAQVFMASFDYEF